MTTEQLHLTFPGRLERERTVAALRTSFPLQVSIRRANVEEQSAWFIVDVTGADDEITRAVAWLLDEAYMSTASRSTGRLAVVHEIRIKVRWRDMDAYGHVNNAVYLNYLEECRDAWAQSVLGGVADVWDFVLAHVGIDFRSQLTQDDGEIAVRCRLDSFGRSSVRTREQILRADGTLSAEAESVIVPRAADAPRSRPLTDAERAILQRELDAGG